MHASLLPSVSSRARRRILSLPVAMLLAGTACGSGSHDADAVRTLVGREVDAVNARDLNALERIWSPNPDVLLFDVASPGRFQGWTAIARTYNEFFEKVSDVKMTVAHLQVGVDGSLAWATYDWTLAGRLGDAALEDRGETTAVYRREKDGWRLVHAHVSASPPLRPEAPSAVTEGAGAGPQGPSAGTPKQATPKSDQPAGPAKAGPVKPPATDKPGARNR